MVTEGHDCPQINMYTIEGPLFFGAANMFEKSIMDTIHLRPKILLLRMGKVPFVDTTGESNLVSLVKHFEKFGGMVLMSGIQPQPLKVLKRTGLFDLIGADHFFEHTGEAIDYALIQLDHNKCLGCKHFAFRECAALSNAQSQQEVINHLEQAQQKNIILGH